MLKSIFILVFSLVFGKSIFCQNLQQTKRFADSLFAAKNYELAKKYYLRALFFGNEIELFEINYSIAQSSYLQNDLVGAIQHFETAYFLCPYDSLKHEILFQKALCFTLLNDYQSAVSELFSITDSLSTNESKKLNYFLGIAHWGLKDYLKSKTYFIHSIDSTYITEKQSIEEIFKSKRLFKRPFPKLAMFMSFILPGSGQIYAGRPKEGINSFILTYSLAALSINIASRLSFFDALFAVGPWYQRYYFGGAQNAKRYAIEKQNRRKFEALSQINEIIRKCQHP